MCVKLLPGEQIPVDDLIWVILEGDPRSSPSEEEQEIGKTLKGGSPRAIKDDVRICLILDCCRCPFAMIHSTFVVSFNLIDFRNAFREGRLNHRKPAPVMAVKNERGFNLKMDIKRLGFNDQILIINSSLLGDRAKDNNSFTQMLLRS